MAGEKPDELLPHHPGGAKNANFDWLLRRAIHCAHDASIHSWKETSPKKNPPTGCSVSGFVSSVVSVLPEPTLGTQIHHQPAESLDSLSAGSLVRREHSGECRRFDCATSIGFAGVSRARVHSLIAYHEHQQGHERRTARRLTFIFELYMYDSNI
jgi:hypothetical protein